MRPLEGHIVVDVSRMLPGAVLARMLASFGARIVKVEDPGMGDPMRYAPPVVDGIGAGFRAFFGGAESITLDLRSRAGATALERIAERADVLVESFRPGTLERWGIGLDRLMQNNSKLVTCSLSSFGAAEPYAHRVGHDLNFVALSGLLSLLPGEAVPRLQLADVSAGLLACSELLAALVARGRTGRGSRIEQPLALAPMPFLTLAWAETVAGGDGASETFLAGACPCYRLYTCGDGQRIALGALEPKFWIELVTAIGHPELVADGLDMGAAGQRAAQLVAARFSEQPRDYWLDLAASRGLPITPVRAVADAIHDPYYIHSGALDFRRAAPAPALGEHTRRVLAEFGIADGEAATSSESSRL